MSGGNLSVAMAAGPNPGITKGPASLINKGKQGLSHWR
ncbi:hypothetical protein J3A64_002891 [Pseudarthrobacter sp. PvP004]|nr:hypothetical protein [Pseudarthrobacter sp. PvP004]